MNVPTFPSRNRREVNGILLVDKPRGPSSNTVLQHVRRLFNAAKAGHTGSLDPLATGLLPVCFGQATKLSGLLLDADKRYRVRARIGERTDTGDAEGSVIETCDPSLERADLERALPLFAGEIQQRPPMYSALKKDGKRLYELARQGETVDRPPRRLTIHALSLVAFEAGHFELDVRCSKGTYIRSLVEDLATAAGSLAHVVELRRLESGPFGAQPMYSLDALEEIAAGGDEPLDRCLLPMLAGLAGWPRVTVGGGEAGRLAHGQAVDLGARHAPGRVAVLGPGGDLLGLGEVSAAGILQPRTWMSGGSGC